MRRPGPPQLVTLVVLVVAAAGQIRVWASGRGFWLDELSIAINLRERSWSELAGWLEYHQVAPVGWLATSKALRDWIGEYELAMRFPSLAGSLAALVLTAVIARRAVGEWAAAAAAGLVGLSPTMLYYSGELKQYAVEAAVALGLLLLGDELYRWDREREPGRTRPAWLPLAGLAAAAAVALTLSYSGLIVLAGITAGLAVCLLVRRRWRSLVALAAVTAPAGLLGAGLAWYRLSQPLAPTQQEHFATGMPAAGSGPPEMLAWLPQMWAGFTEQPLAWRSAWWTLVLLVVGLAALVARRRYHWAAMLAGVLGLAVAVALARGLPLADRVALYLVGPVVLLVVAGLDGLARGVVRLGEARLAAPRPRQAPAVPAVPVVRTAAASVAIGVMVLAGPAIGDGVDEALAPRNRDLGREALADLGNRLEPGDLVIAYWASGQLVRWYGPDAGVEVAGRVRLVPAGDAQRCRPGSVDRLLADAPRVWYLHGAAMSADPDDYTVRVAQELARRGEIVDARTVGGGPLGIEPGWMLVDLTAGPDPAPPVADPDPEYACFSRVG